MEQRRPVIMDRAHASDPCANCEARPLSVCAAVDDSDLDKLARVAVVQHYEPGQSFIEEGEKADHFFNMTGGTARLYKLLPDGRRQITGFSRAGNFLGLAVSDTYGFSAEAIDRVRVCRFARTKLYALLEDFPAMEKRLLATAGNELVAAQEQMLLLGRKTARERLASFLINISREDAPCAPPRTVLHLPMTRTDIADYLGLTIETVSRTFTRFKTERLVSLPSVSEIVILDRARLTRLAEGG
ncbi:MAG TPA: helix-turn-helix domain-containing protein [Acetobacteraceae bacterium]|nr:helix-turn-helix domain-containing protein [Acetobacteraceae bacterium]